MKKLGIIFLLAGCSHQELSLKTVEFPYAEELVEKVQKRASRLPASLTVEDVSSVSPRRVYFTALYQQYQVFSQYLDKKSDIHFCPQFHHDKLQIDSSLVPKVTMYHSSQMSEEGRAYFPEMAFGKKFSLSDYQSQMRDELNILCEEGVSDNYYKFDNLVTHYAQRPSFHQNKQAMASVLKIPVFANFYLVKMLEVTGLEKESLEEKAFIKLSNTYWFEDYIKEASKMRNLFIKNKMVRR